MWVRRNLLFCTRFPWGLKRVMYAFKKIWSREMKECDKITTFSITMDILRLCWEFRWEYFKNRSIRVCLNQGMANCVTTVCFIHQRKYSNQSHKKSQRWTNTRLQMFNNYWTRSSKISQFVSGELINYLPKPKAEANNLSARHWLITIFCGDWVQ